MIDKYEVDMQVFPEMYYYTIDKDKNLLLNKFDKPSLKFRHTNYFLGRFSLDSSDFKLALSKGDFKTSILIEKSQKDFFPINDYRRQEYTFLDTLEINSQAFQISKIKINPLRIELKKIIIPPNIKGFRIGQRIDDYMVEDLKGNNISLKAVAGRKDLILIDFWGTWCAPVRS